MSVEQDAARWRYVCDELVQGMDFRMDGTCIWRFRSPLGRGATIEEVIDRLISQNGPDGEPARPADAASPPARPAT
jgi:hypothetical protein